ncbi:hypothetical protein VTI28DRAFT_3120 [Corynascus sepedonium]
MDREKNTQRENGRKEEQAALSSSGARLETPQPWPPRAVPGRSVMTVSTRPQPFTSIKACSESPGHISRRISDTSFDSFCLFAAERRSLNTVA